MKTRTVWGSILAVAVACGGMSLPALAVPVTQTIKLDQVFTGTVPNGPAPWLTATFVYDNDGSSNTGTLTLQSHLTSGDFVKGGTGQITGWNFFINSGFSLSTLSCTGTYCAASTRTTLKAIGPNGPNGGTGSFNLGFGWLAGNTFDGTDSAIYTLTFASPLTGDPFGANSLGWWSVAHVQGINVQGCDDSGWIVSGANGQNAGSGICGTPPPPHNVPEPGALGMFGLGVLLMGGFLGWRRRYS